MRRDPGNRSGTAESFATAAVGRALLGLPAYSAALLAGQSVSGPAPPLPAVGRCGVDRAEHCGGPVQNVVRRVSQGLSAFVFARLPLQQRGLVAQFGSRLTSAVGQALPLSEGDGRKLLELLLGPLQLVDSRGYLLAQLIQVYGRHRSTFPSVPPSGDGRGALILST